MPVSGRRRKPAILHVLQGTLESYHKGREFEPIAEGDIGDAPEEFTAEEKREWGFVRANAPARMLATPGSARADRMVPSLRCLRSGLSLIHISEPTRLLSISY